MTPDEDQDLVLRQSPYLTVVFVFFQLSYVVPLLHVYNLGLSPEWLHNIIHAIIGMLVVICGYLGIAAAILAVLNIPVLQTSEEGISVRMFWGRQFVRWSDIAEIVPVSYFTIMPVNYSTLEIRLRDGARSLGWKRYLLWPRPALLVQTFTTAARPEAVARTLTEIKGRRLADHAG